MQLRSWLLHPLTISYVQKIAWASSEDTAASLLLREQITSVPINIVDGSLEMPVVSSCAELVD